MLHVTLNKNLFFLLDVFKDILKKYKNKKKFKLILVEMGLRLQI